MEETILFHTPLKSPDAARPSGDRRMAQLFRQALEYKGFSVFHIDVPSTYDGKGDLQRQKQMRHDVLAAARRLPLRRYGKAVVNPVLWLTYHVYYKAPDWIGPLMARYLGVPLMLAEASYAARRGEGSWALGHSGAVQAIRRADRILCLTRRDHVGLKAIAAPSALRYLPPFIDTTPFTAAAMHREAAAAQLRQHLAIDGTQPILLTIAMMREGDKVASYDALVCTLSRLLDRDWVLVVAGDGSARHRVMDGLWSLGEARLRYLKSVAPADIPRLAVAADLYIWPGVGEAFGMAYLEAQAAATPVIAWDCAGVPEVVQHGRGGLLAPAGDHAALASQTAALLDDPAQRRILGQRGARIVRRQHDLPMAASMLAQEIADCRKSPRECLKNIAENV